MPKLPTSAIDPTLSAANEAMVRANKPRHSNALGASWIGMACERAVWFKFHHAKLVAPDARALKLFEDGYAVEDVVVARIAAVPGVEWHARDGVKQYGFSDFGGHHRGYYDGVVRGLLQAPATWHIGEVKASAKWADLDKSKAKVGEKSALLHWNPIYYAQAQVYMHAEGLTRHYLVAASPGARDWTSVRTDYDPAAALRLRAKAERVIFGNAPAERIGEADSFACRFCDFHGLCHGSELPDRECRGCIHATALREGGWKCEAGHAFGTVCGDHRYVPSMLNGEQTDMRDGNVVYQMKDGEYVDCGGQEAD